MRIVIVEDEQQTREGLSRLLERIDPAYQVVALAANGEAGLQCIQARHPDVVITDIRMPKMDGLEMTEALSRLPQPPKFIILSAFSEFSYAKRAMSFGVSEYLLKPLSMADLKQSLEKIELQLQAAELREPERSLETVIRTLVLDQSSVEPSALARLAASYALDESTPFALLLFYFGDRYSSMRDPILRLSAPKLQEQCTHLSTVFLDSKRSVLFVLRGFNTA